jgi:hypothetical protein
VSPNSTAALQETCCDTVLPATALVRGASLRPWSYFFFPDGKCLGECTGTGRTLFHSQEGAAWKCTDYGHCVNAWNSVSSSMGNARFNGEDEENDRRLRAAELIKETCPGKPY